MSNHHDAMLKIVGTAQSIAQKRIDDSITLLPIFTMKRGKARLNRIQFYDNKNNCRVPFAEVGFHPKIKNLEQCVYCSTFDAIAMIKAWRLFFMRSNCTKLSDNVKGALLPLYIVNNGSFPGDDSLNAAFHFITVMTDDEFEIMNKKMRQWKFEEFIVQSVIEIRRERKC